MEQLIWKRMSKKQREEKRNKKLVALRRSGSTDSLVSDQSLNESENSLEYTDNEDKDKSLYSARENPNPLGKIDRNKIDQFRNASEDFAGFSIRN